MDPWMMDLLVLERQNSVESLGAFRLLDLVLSDDASVTA